MPVPVVVEVAVLVVVDVVVEPVFIVGMIAADSFSFSLSALSSDQYLTTKPQVTEKPQTCLKTLNCLLKTHH